MQSVVVVLALLVIGGNASRCVWIEVLTAGAFGRRPRLQGSSRAKRFWELPKGVPWAVLKQIMSTLGMFH